MQVQLNPDYEVTTIDVPKENDLVYIVSLSLNPLKILLRLNSNESMNNSVKSLIAHVIYRDIITKKTFKQGFYGHSVTPKFIIVRKKHGVL